jgi:enamine deaminase RidA (YjgF/YER057c/UK114 family)
MNPNTTLIPDTQTSPEPQLDIDPAWSRAEILERQALGLPRDDTALPGSISPIAIPRPAAIRRRAICAPDVLNEASEYGSAFPRGLRLDFPNGLVQLLISGTASVGANGETLYPGDFAAQCWRTFRNITRLLASEDATWLDIVRTTCYLRDIERDYSEFNRIRNEFYQAMGLDPYPASTAIQARICRSDLLVEIEAVAMFYRGNGA